MAVKISVIMPVYNCERYLEEALRSVLSQSVSDLEVIAVDDGSTDSSRDILRKCAEKDTRIHPVFNEKNLGASAVRNLALDAASGEYVAFCDSDDIVPPGAYEALLKAADGKDIAVGTFDNIYYDGSEYVRSEHCPLSREAHESDFLAILTYCCLPTKLIRLSFLREHDLHYDESMKVGEDVVLLAQIAAQRPTCALTDTTVYHYCHHRHSVQRSLTRTYTMAHYRDHIECRRRLLEICKVAPECRDFVYLHLIQVPARLLNFLSTREDQYQAFELFREHVKGYDYEKKPLFFKALTGVEFEALLKMSPEQFFDHQRELDSRDRVAAEFDCGMIGLRWIWRYFKGWLRFKLKHSYQ